MKSADKVTSIHASTMDSGLSKIRDSLKVVPWKVLAHMVLDALGLEAGPQSWTKETTVGIESLACSLGYTSVGDFVCGAKGQPGLGMEWASWEETAKGHYYFTKYEIARSEINEILSEYNEVSAFLKRDPVSKREFNAVKTKLFEASLNNASAVSSEIERQVDELKKEVGSKELIVAERTESLKATVMERDSALEKLHEESVTSRKIGDELRQALESVKVLNSKVVDLEGKLSVARLKESEQAATIEDQQNQINEYKNELVLLREKADDLQKRIDVLPEDTSNLASKVIGLQEALIKKQEEDIRKNASQNKQIQELRSIKRKLLIAEKRVNMLEKSNKCKAETAKQDKRNLWILGVALAVCVILMGALAITL